MLSLFCWFKLAGSGAIPSEAILNEISLNDDMRRFRPYELSYAIKICLDCNMPLPYVLITLLRASSVEVPVP